MIQALFVHGMGRSPLSGWPLLRQLKRAGFRTSTFGYFVSVESFLRIRERLAARIEVLAARGEYVLIGHSLGGVLLRAALSSLPPGSRQPRHVFLLGSPVQPARLARRLQSNPAFRLLTGDCGRLLGSTDRMAEIGRLFAPATSIVGTRGLIATRGPFMGELNDGVVAVAEASAEWLPEQVQVSCIHAFLPSNRRVTAAIVERLREMTLRSEDLERARDGRAHVPE